MQMSDEIHILAPRDVVYAALNDPNILKRCIPGCQDIERTDDNSFAATVKLKIGPVAATFKGRVVLDTSSGPGHFSLSGNGEGGVAGMARGAADVDLDDQGSQTLLRYTAHADVAGKLAQLGSRLIVSTSERLAKQFFANFKAAVEGSEAQQSA